jgi:hypothetical protein
MPWGFSGEWLGWPPVLDFGLPEGWLDFANEYARLTSDISAHRAAAGLSPMWSPIDLRNPFMWTVGGVSAALMWLDLMWNTQPATPSGPAQSLLIECSDITNYTVFGLTEMKKTLSTPAQDVTVWFLAENILEGCAVSIVPEGLNCAFTARNIPGYPYFRMGSTDWGSGVLGSGWHSVRWHAEADHIDGYFDGTLMTTEPMTVTGASAIRLRGYALSSSAVAPYYHTHTDTYFSEVTTNGDVDYFDSLTAWVMEQNVGDNGTATLSTAQIHSGGGGGTPLPAIRPPGVGQVDSSLITTLRSWISGAGSTIRGHIAGA